MDGVLGTLRECNSALSRGHGKTVRAERLDRYTSFWREIRRLAPQAVLLRGPAQLNPFRSSGRDLDILLPSHLPAVKAFLYTQGFCRTYRPEPYIENFQLWLADDPEPYGIDLYKTEAWGLGFCATGNGFLLADQRLACLLHAVVDRKGTAYFEKLQNGPPWQPEGNSKSYFTGPLGRALWRRGHTRALTVYLALAGVIRPHFPMILRNLLRRVAFRLWQMMQKRGVEVGLMGVDGTGKSSLAQSLLRLPVPTKIVYMGRHDYQTRVMRFAANRRLPTLVSKWGPHYEFFVRRVCGWLFSRRGHLVIYDRHPLEHQVSRPTCIAQKIKNCLKGIYAWPLDLTLWLTGDYVKIEQRKREYPAGQLKAMDLQFYELLQKHSISYRRIDVTREDLASVTRKSADLVLAKYREYASIDSLPGVLRKILD